MRGVHNPVSNLLEKKVSDQDGKRNKPHNENWSQWEEHDPDDTDDDVHGGAVGPIIVPVEGNGVELGDSEIHFDGFLDEGVAQGGGGSEEVSEATCNSLKVHIDL